MNLKNGIWFCVLITMIGNFACEEERDPYFLISSDQAGLIARNISLAEAEDLYENDSLVRDSVQLSIGLGNDKLKIYQSGGQHLMTLTPKRDSIQSVEHVLIADPRLTTAEGIGLNSTFKDIKEKYEIEKIITSLNNIVVLLKDSNMYFTIDKGELPSHLKFTKTRPIELVEIPDKARIKYFMISWD